MWTDSILILMCFLCRHSHERVEVKILMKMWTYTWDSVLITRGLSVQELYVDCNREYGSAIWCFSSFFSFHMVYAWMNEFLHMLYECMKLWVVIFEVLRGLEQFLARSFGSTMRECCPSCCYCEHISQSLPHGTLQLQSHKLLVARGGSSSHLAFCLWGLGTLVMELGLQNFWHLQEAAWVQAYWCDRWDRERWSQW